MNDTIQLVFKRPSKSTPGYPKRMRRAMHLQQLSKSDPKPEIIDELVEFLADFVVADNHEVAVELIWMCSEEQWDTMLGAIGGAPDAEVPSMKSETSEKA